MSRGYDSTRRQRQALETRRRILDAAVRLHAQGITEVRPLAEAAGVSLPTVRKHFPSKERIFEGCTAHFLSGFTPPDFVAAAAAVADSSARAARVVELLAGVHEASHDLIWHAYPAATESPALAAALANHAALVDQAVDALEAAEDRPSAAALRRRARLRGLLDTLTYRALRVHAGLDARATREELTELVRASLAQPSEHLDNTPPTPSTSSDIP